MMSKICISAPMAWISEADAQRLAQSQKPLQLWVFSRDPSDISGTPYVALAPAPLIPETHSTNTADLVTVPDDIRAFVATSMKDWGGDESDHRSGFDLTNDIVAEVWRRALAASPAHATGAAMREGWDISAIADTVIEAVVDSFDVDWQPRLAKLPVEAALRAALSSPAPEGEAAQGVEPGSDISDAHVEDVIARLMRSVGLFGACHNFQYLRSQSDADREAAQALKALIQERNAPRLWSALRRAGFALEEALSVIDADADPVTFNRIQAEAKRIAALAPPSVTQEEAVRG